MKTLTKIFLVLLIANCSLTIVNAQNIAITDDDAYSANSSAMLDVKSTTKGMLVPRLTTAQRTAVASPATGLLIFDTDAGSFYFYNGTSWVNLTSGNASGILSYTAPDKVYLTDASDKFGVGTISPNNKLDIRADATNGIDQAIFNVVNNDGDTIFAVYPQGVRINVADNSLNRASSTKGGFAVGGFSPDRATINEYLRVTPDSVRIYIEESDENRASSTKGGFAVGGYSPGRGLTNEFLRVTNDSTRIWTEDTIAGFGVQNIGASNKTSYLKLTPKNYFIGHEAGRYITTGKFNSFIGYQSGYRDTSGSYNSFMGYMSGYNNLGGGGSYGDKNSFYGYLSGYSNTTGWENVFVGATAGYSNTTGYLNTFLGADAGSSTSTGWSLTFLGSNAGNKLFSGINSTFVGSMAGFYSTNCSYNTFVGAQSGEYNDTGERNTYVGNLSGYYNQTGSSNACFGDLAGYFSAEGSNNTYIGKSAGQGNTSGSNNVMVGTSAGNSSTGTGNVFIGYNAGYSESYSNKLYIENSNADSDDALIYGNFATNRVQINNYLGIGEYPSYTLDVAGVTNLNKGLTGVALRVNGDEALWYDGTYFSWGYEGTYNFFADKVGIGQTNPTYKLELPNNSSASLGCGRAYAWNTYSDSRVKLNQVELNYGLDEIMRLSAKRFDHYESSFTEGSLLLGNTHTNTIGLIAQEVFCVIPEAVTRPINDSTDLWSLDYVKLVPILIKSIQEQQQQIEQLYERNKFLDKKSMEIDQLKSEIEKLKILIYNMQSNK
ncbi:MAG TPA: hypothetical protein DDX39_00175 [Bacteroidales bacterium]|nr:MAG: hypothetical protein A2W98_03380 [Bacteroidetes bacterium GWF2_33_38]OFY75784.1 MAG: hypothetical protein A2265_11345 [Bacteroidetes bacterium RIFOXYA12_FULL_33_9]OFY85796.1 MAG: hypothetical protein A2236_06015 [Bacteroidetes bacterium RIFOXYA2_FULL_33_7]HBF87025.1 hypothetical protein [Bacteroidales bacterium]